MMVLYPKTLLGVSRPIQAEILSITSRSKSLTPVKFSGKLVHPGFR